MEQQLFAFVESSRNTHSVYIQACTYSVTWRHAATATRTCIYIYITCICNESSSTIARVYVYASTRVVKEIACLRCTYNVYMYICMYVCIFMYNIVLYFVSEHNDDDDGARWKMRTYSIKYYVQYCDHQKMRTYFSADNII